MKCKPLGNSGMSAPIVGLGARVLGDGQIWGQDTVDAKAGELNLEATDVTRIRQDMSALGEPKES